MRVFLVMILVALAMPLVACGSNLGAGVAVGPVPAPELRRFYAQELDWTRCGKFDCTYLEVPMDYQRPGGKTIRLAVLRSKASQRDQRIGSLVVNPGGPGGSGTDLAIGISENIRNTPLGERFDLVGFDPRGVGHSEPVIKCRSARERDDGRLYRATDAPPANDEERRADDAETEQYYRDEIVAKCVERSGVDLLANVGTRDVARDMDVLRSALGDERLSYLGFSYGTRIGYTYAEAFPANVRAMVLDGADDPNADPAAAEVAQEAAFQAAFDVFAGWCAQQAQCPLGNDPKSATAKFQRLLAPLLKEPMSLADGRKLARNDAEVATVHSLYRPQSWETLRQGLTDLAAGKGQTLMRIADSFHKRGPDGTYSGSKDALLSIRCVDEKPNTDQAAALEQSKRELAAAPFRDDGSGPSSARDVCAFWPVPPTSVAHQPHVDGLAPTMVISTTGDPATPYQAGIDLARALHSRLLTVHGTQHTAALDGDRCVDDMVARYLTDLTLPPEGANCTIAPPA